MPISFDLEALRKEHECVHYFETGLWDPTTNVSSKMALNSGFNHVFCIEIRNDWVELGKEIFQDEIKNGRYTLILDDSTNMNKYIHNELFKDKTMFFLDAHVDNDNIHNYKKRCPLFDELEAIKSMSRNDHIILIDDLRVIKTPFPWHEHSYGSINFEEEIKKKILSINENYKFKTLDGYIKDDVLMAYI